MRSAARLPSPQPPAAAALQVPPEPDDEYDAYSDGFGVGWHAQEGLLGTGGSVRALNRGLTTFVFVPWEELETTELNSSADEMDYYVPG